MAIQRLNRTWVDGELWDAVDDANPIGQKIDEVVDQVNLSTSEIETARAGSPDLNTRINLLETSAATSASNALSYLNDFKGRYYGAYSSDPATDPLGNPVDTGDVYYNTTEGKLKYWTGSTWDYWNQDADTVDGYHAGNASGNIPISNGTVNTNLNADKVDDFDASQTPAPNVIVPLDANGVLNLSATYVRSNVYTFRRVDLTNATSDYMLQVGEEAYISFSNTTSVPLRIATQSGTYYECHVVCSNTGGTSGGTAAPIFLNPNNTTYSSSFVFAQFFRNSQEIGSAYITYSAFRCGWAFVSSVSYITNFVQYKNVKGILDVYGTSPEYPAVAAFSTDWRNTTTPWTSLGTITFPQATSGYIIVRRLV